MRVLIISPQHWGIMRVTKHHYSIELAKLGHDVFFLEPTEPTWKLNQSSFKISDSDIERLKVIHQKINIPYNLKFHSKRLYDWFIRNHIKKLEKQIGPFNLVWSFDIENSMPLKFFASEAKKIFFASDWPLQLEGVKAAKGAHLLVSIAQEILDQFPSTTGTKRLLLDHGVAECFIEAGKLPFVKSDDIIRIGMSGNFLRPDIDRQTLLEIIRNFNNIIFECFGSFEYINSNMGGGVDSQTSEFINELRESPNVILHGMLHPESLALELRRMDIFLICYDLERDYSKGTNYHKVMEFLCYRRPIVSNYVSRYKNVNLIYIQSPYRHEQNWVTIIREVISIKNINDYGLNIPTYFINLSKILSTLNS